MTHAVNLAPPFTLVGTSSDRDSWLTLRNGGIGASEMPILLGESEWGSNLELWAAKRGEPIEREPETELMELGRELECAILRVVMRRAGVDGTPRLSGYLLRSTEHPWAICTPDAVTTGLEPVEVKNLSFGYDEEAWSESVPEKYRIQVNHQMLVLGARRALFGTLVWGARVIWEWVPRDEMLIRRIVRTGSEFWRHVENGTEPPSDGHKNARKVLAKRATEEASVELFRDEVDEPLTRYSAASSKLAQLRKEARDAEKVRNSAADAIAQMMGKARYAITSDGWEFAWKRSARKGFTVDPKVIDQFTIKEPKK